MFLFIILFLTVTACQIENCTQCVTGNDLQCEKCNDDSFVTGNGLCALRSKLENCHLFHSKGCLECLDGYVMVNSYSCMACSDFFPFCQKCEMNQCIKCQSGYSFQNITSNMTAATQVCGSKSILVIAVLLLLVFLLWFLLSEHFFVCFISHKKGLDEPYDRTQKKKNKRKNKKKRKEKKMSDVKTQIASLRKNEVTYICAKCGSETKFKIKEDTISCSSCGCRILYKKRTTEPVEFEAR